MAKRKDNYDRQIDELMKVPKDGFRSVICKTWIEGKGLFQYLIKNPEFRGCGFGCPTMVKGCAGGTEYRAETKRLTDMVLRSTLIPIQESMISQDRAVLNEFARIQRAADRMVRRRRKKVTRAG